MAEITTLEEKLAEVTGLARAAKEATEKVESLVDDGSVAETLQRMRDEAEETERRCSELIDHREGKKTAILDKAQETKREATEMMATYLGEDSDGLDGFEFLTMAEAGEVGHWAVLGKLNEKAGTGVSSGLTAPCVSIRHKRGLSSGREGGTMSTVAIIAIVVAALILVAIVVSVAQRSRARRQVGQAQVEAQHDDVRHHRDQAEQRRNEAALSEERARRAAAEAELNEKRAGEREQELEN